MLFSCPLLGKIALDTKTAWLNQEQINVLILTLDSWCFEPSQPQGMTSGLLEATDWRENGDNWKTKIVLFRRILVLKFFITSRYASTNNWNRTSRQFSFFMVYLSNRTVDTFNFSFIIVYLWNRTSRQFSFVIAYLWNRTSRQLSFFIWLSIYLSVCFFQKGICSPNMRMFYTKSALILKLLCVWITYGDGAEVLRASTITCSPLFSSHLTNKLDARGRFSCTRTKNAHSEE